MRKILAIGICLLFLLIFLPYQNQKVQGIGEGWLNEWTSRKSHSLLNSTGSGSNYSISIVVENSSYADSGETVRFDNKSQPDFEDVRFTEDDGSTLLDYWCQNWSLNTNARFWIRIPDDLSSANYTFYVYVGNLVCSSISNITNVFPFGDDFNRDNSTVVGNGWIEDNDAGTSSNISSNVLQFYNHELSYYNHVQQTPPNLANFSYEGRIKGSGSGQSWYDALMLYWSFGNGVRAGKNGYGVSVIRSDYIAGGTWHTLGEIPKNEYNWGFWYRITLTPTELIANYSYDCIIWNEFGRVSRPSQFSGVPSLIAIGEGYMGNPPYTGLDWDNSYAGWTGNFYYYADDVFFRKFNDPEPSHGSWGSEEYGATSTPTSNVHLWAYQNNQNISVMMWIGISSYVTPVGLNLTVGSYTCQAMQRYFYNRTHDVIFKNWTDGVIDSQRTIMSMTNITNIYVAQYEFEHVWDIGGYLNIGIGLVGLFLMFGSWIALKVMWSRDEYPQAILVWLVMFLIGIALFTVLLGG